MKMRDLEMRSLVAAARALPEVRLGLGGHEEGGDLDVDSVNTLAEFERRTNFTKVVRVAVNYEQIDGDGDEDIQGPGGSAVPRKRKFDPRPKRFRLHHGRFNRASRSIIYRSAGFRRISLTEPEGHWEDLPSPGGQAAQRSFSERSRGALVTHLRGVPRSGRHQVANR